jgi:phosphatidylserine/phosphatidylglycerophosphate/cardiolipin synthase-like enzyme
MTTPGRRIPRDRVITAITSRRSTILSIIRHARRRIALSMFRCDDEAILSALAQAISQGVAVDVLVTRRAKGGRRPLERLRTALHLAGASVHEYVNPVVKYHAKYLIADDGPAVVASLNFTRKCFERTCDALVVTHDPEIVSGLQQLMAADRDGQPIPEGLSRRLIVGPEGARLRFKALIEEAQSSIRLIDSKLSDADLLRRLEARRAKGVAVEIFDSKRVGGLKSHGKIMCIDDRLAIVGSAALSAPSLDLRREVAITVDHPAAVAEIRHLFRWAATVPSPGRAVAANAAGWASC